MENESKIHWVLTGIRVKGAEPEIVEGEAVLPDDQKLPQEIVNKLLVEAFMPGKRYKLFLCGAMVEKDGNLEEMEEGYHTLLEGMEDYQYGDYGIISEHEEADLLFMPAELSDEEIAEINAQDLSGDTDPVQ